MKFEADLMDERREGKREGRREGKREGRREGKREGRREGRREGKREGKREGLAEGVEIATFESVRDGDFSPERGAQKLGLKLSDFLKKLDRAGYKIPSMA